MTAATDKAAAREMGRLSEYVLLHQPTAIKDGESVVDVAIRLLESRTTAPVVEVPPFVVTPIQGLTIVGVSGKAGAGKDWLGSLLQPWGYRKWALAWHLKQDALKAGFSYDDVHLHKPAHVRTYLQQVGTEQGRDRYGRDCWLRVAHGWLTLLRREHGLRKVLVPDVRFLNEVEFVQALGGKVIRLFHGDRPYPLQGTPQAEHESETALDGYQGFDLEIFNHKRYTAREAIAAMSAIGGILT